MERLVLLQLHRNAEKEWKYMKRLNMLVVALISVLGLVGCSNYSISDADRVINNNSIPDIDKAVKIEVSQYDKSNGKETGKETVTDDVIINRIVDNLNSLKLSKKMKNTEPTVIDYTLIFYNENGEIFEKVYIPAHEWIDYDGGFRSIMSGELDRTYLASLFKTQE